MKTKFLINCLSVIIASLVFSHFFISCDEPKEEKPPVIHNHEWGNWRVIDEPTETESGMEKRSCIVPGCSEDETMEIPPLGVATEPLSFMLINGGTAYSVAGGTLKGPEIEIPDTYEGLPVVSIRNNAFWSYKNMTSIIIPDSITSIGRNAFYNCSNLEEIFIPAGVASIGDNAFFGCASLTSIDVDTHNKNYVSSEGILCDNPTTKIIHIPAALSGEIVIPDGVESISERAFFNFSITTVTIGNSVTRIGNEAFANCAGLEYVTIGSGVKIIGNGAFRNCETLSDAEIPDGVTSIGESAFYNCAIYSMIIPGSVINIDDNAFGKCIYLEEVVIENGVTSIGNGAFRNCESLNTIVIPNSLTFIGNSAFYNCFSLEAITIPSGVTSIADYAFYNCYSLSEVILPSGVTSIGSYAFFNCRELWSIEIPNGVTVIGESAFFGCLALAEITIPNGVTSIGNNAFENCYNLEYAAIGSGVTRIGNGAFRFCKSLYTIVIPENVKSIGALAFYNCENLQVVTFRGLISEENFAGSMDDFSGIVFNSPFDGNLREVYFDNGGGIGKYLRYGSSPDDYYWEKDQCVLEHEGLTEPKAATCTEAGNSEYHGTCTRCGTFVAGTVIPALGHSGLAEPKAATCIEAGNFEKHGTCTRCHTVITGTVEPARGHHTSNGTEPTCTVNGNTGTGTCERQGCGVYITGTVLPAPGHAGLAEPKAATCTEDGNTEKHGTCMRCHVDVIGTVIPSHGGHLGLQGPEAATCTTAGNSEEHGTCTRCGTVVPGTVVPAEHDHTSSRLCKRGCGHSYSVGDIGPGGGIIFYVNWGTGFTLTSEEIEYKAFYLEAAPKVQHYDNENNYIPLTWASGGFTNTLIGGTETAIGTGKKNTALILAKDANAPAAKACADYRGGGKTDWFFPSKDELNQMGSVNISGYYQSSTESNAQNRWGQNFSNGAQGTESKAYDAGVRAIRAF